MVGLLVQTPENLIDSGIITSIIPSMCQYGYVYSSNEYTYPFSYAFFGDTILSASAVTQKLIDEGCTMIIYLGESYSYRTGLMNVTDEVCPKLMKSFKKPRFVKYTGEGIMQGSLQCVTDSSDVIDRPYDVYSAGVVNACLLNNVQLLVLVSQDETGTKRDSKFNYQSLGSALLDKFELILRTDYNTYEQSSNEITEVANASVKSFKPVTMSRPFMELPSRFKSHN